MAGGLPVATMGDTNDPIGIRALTPPFAPTASITPTVMAMGKPVLCVGAIIPTHGNPSNTHAPGFDTSCAASFIATGVPNVLVYGKPIAVVGPFAGGSLYGCGHWVMGPGAPTVLVGTGG